MHLWEIKRIMLLDQSITKLNLDPQLIEKLHTKKIRIISDVWKLKRKELKDLGLNDYEINQIMIKMQLQGIDLNHKIYRN